MTREAGRADALDVFPEPVLSIDEQGCVRRWNRACALVLGIEPQDALGRPLADLLDLEDRDATGAAPDRRWVRCGPLRLPVEITRWRSAESGVELEHLMLRDAVHRVLQEAEDDRAAEVLRRQARFDALTGLANRYELEERLTQALRAPQDGRVALLVADLDGFKPINDAYGHAVGDEVLAAVGRRLRGCVRADAVVARLGGDEFVVLTRVLSAVAPSELAQRVRQSLSRPVQTSEGSLPIGVSVGVAVAEPGSEDAADLLRRADKAMYRVKIAGAPPE